MSMPPRKMVSYFNLCAHIQTLNIPLLGDSESMAISHVSL